MNEIKLLEAFRKKHKKTYEQLGRELGVANRTIYRWLKGEATPHPFMVEKILSYVQINP